MQEQKCIKCEKIFKDYLSNHRQYCSRKCAYSTFTRDYRHDCQECSITFTDKKKYSKFCGLSCSGKNASRFIVNHRGNTNRGNKHWNWQGGKPRNLRLTTIYKDWRKAVFERDDYTCQLCGTRGGEIIADHIKPFAYFPELRLVIDNGRTLCKVCNYEVTYITKEWRKYGLNT